MKNVLDQLKEIAVATMYATEGAELESVLERIAHVAREVANTRYAALGVPDGEGGLRFFKTSGMTEEQIARMPHYPLGLGLIGAIMDERRPIIVDKMSDDPRSVGFPKEHPPMHSLLGVPVIMGGQLFGTLYLCDKVDGQPFNESDKNIIEMLAGYAAFAIAGAEHAEQRKLLSLLEERERISMELHDGVIQSLYGVGMQIDLIRLNSSGAPATQLVNVVNSLNDVIEDIRSYIMHLRTSYNGGTMLECVLRVKNRLHIPEKVDLILNVPDEKPPFTPVVFESICLILMEAISNAVRHAHATKIQIAMGVEGNQFVMTISDDGKGFDTDEPDYKRGLGLRNMEERAQLYGGHVTVTSRPNEGTQATITVPVRLK